MAIFLKQDFDLLAFSVMMDMRSRPTIRCTLEQSTNGEIEVLRVWEYTPEEFGLPAKIGRGGRDRLFSPPAELLNALSEDLSDQLAPDTVLWLHLRNPIGYLDMVAWEQVLQPRLNVPVLRLPEFLVDPPRHSLSRLNVALCSSLPRAKSAFSAPAQLVNMTQALLSVSSRNTTVHIFADSAMYSELHARCREINEFQGRVDVHDPATAEPYSVPNQSSRIVDPVGQLENPWLLWIRDEMKALSLDMVHFLVHGYYSQDRGALALAESPLRNEDRRYARFVGAGELSTFLTHVGAWSVGFTSPEDNYSSNGLRHLAHTLAQRRPGPLFYHDSGWEADVETLAQTYAFLFGDTGKPPAVSTLALYCHPGRLRGVAPHTPLPLMSGMPLGMVQSTPAPDLSRPAAPQPKSVRPDNRAIDDDAPTWEVAAERYIEQRSLALSKEYVERSQGDDDSTTAQRMETLAQIAKIVREATGSGIES